MIDAFVLTVLWVLLSAVSGGLTTQGGSANANLNGWWFALFLLAFFGYYFVLELAFGSSLGKHLLGLRVVNLSDAPAGPRAILVRNLLRFVDVLPLYYVIGIIAIAASKRRQRLGDMVAGTIIVRRSE